MIGRVELKKLFVTLVAMAICIFPATVLADEEEPEVLTLSNAITLGLEQNLNIKQFAVDVNLMDVQADKADFFSDKLKDADKAIKNGWKELADQKALFEANKDYMDEETKAYYEQEIAAAEQELLDNSQYTIDTLEEAKVKDLIEEKAQVGVELTSLGYDLAKTKTRLLIKKTYYDALQQKALLDVKQKAYDRALGQLKLAQAGYEEGMKAKDDVLLSEIQVSLREADLRKAQSDYENSLLELKKILNMPLGKKIVLQDELVYQKESFELYEGLFQGMSMRIEVKKAERELHLSKLNMEITERYTAPNTFDYKEAKYATEKAEITLEQAKAQVEAEIRQSYNTVLATDEIVDLVEGSVSKAEKNLEIANYKYKEGFGISSANLKAFDLEEAAGTVMEVLAAQETLATVEEQYVKSIYGYNLAKAKYLNDIMADMEDIQQ